jgi:hypothetical protein
VDRLYSYDNHLQEYYPLWLPDGLTFKGTRLPDNMQNLSDQVDSGWSPYYYVLIGFRYGYADNLSNWTDKSDANSWNYEGCGIDISWAVDENRQPVDLDFVDFVRVYTGLNQKCPQPDWWGETSTEIQAAEDIHLEASIEDIKNAQTGIRSVIKDASQKRFYDLQGRNVIPTKKGVYIQNRKKIVIN